MPGNNNITEIFKSLGMTDTEVKIYLKLLDKKESSVNQIVSELKLHRQVCYDALDRLVEKGFASYVLKENKTYFKALGPEKIIDYLEERMEEVNSVLPQLKEIAESEKTKTEVKVVKGRAILRIIDKDIIKELEGKKGTIFAIGVDLGKSMKFDRIATKQYLLRLKKNNLKEKSLVKEGAKDLPKVPQVEYRSLPEHLFNPTPITVYGDKVAIIVWKEPAYGIIISNKQVADANRKYFELLWKTAKKIKK